jgi:hypothetical protein
MVLPEGLNGTATLIFLVCGGIVWALIQFGIIGGKRSANNPKASPGANEIVAITVDSRAIDKLAGEVAGLSVAMTGHALASKELAASNHELARKVDGLTEELQDINVELRVTREVAKAWP